MTLGKVIKFALSIIICFIIGLSGSYFTSSSVNSWYRTLNKPSFTPPDWIFAPVWTLIYLLMGISLFFVWISSNPLKYLAFIAFSAQLLLNFLWSVIFFGFENLHFALAEIIALWGSILITIFLFRRISNMAAYLLIPYILWVSFAAFLNYSIVRMN